MEFEREAVTSYGLGPLGVIVPWRNWLSVNFDTESNLAHTDCIDDRLQYVSVSVYDE